MQNLVMYAHLSMLVGLAQLADAVLLYKNRGSLPKWLVAFSYFEYMWAGISISSFASTSPRWLPVSFVVYVLAGVAYGIYLAQSKTSSISTGIPVWFICLGGIFGFYFLMASLYVSVSA